MKGLSVCVYVYGGGYACIATSKVYKALWACRNRFILLKKEQTNSTVVWLPGCTDVCLWRRSESFRVPGWDITPSHKVFGGGCKSAALRGSSGPPPWEGKHTVSKAAKLAAPPYLALTPVLLVFPPRCAPQPSESSASAQVWGSCCQI